MMISFILPVYNCFEKLEAALPDFIKELETIEKNYQVIIVDDGSADKADLSKYLNEKIILLTNSRNFGKGYSIRKAMMQAVGDKIIFMDGDFPFHPGVMREMCNSISEHTTDIVIGDRSIKGSSYPEPPVLRNAGSKIISIFVKSFILKGFKDTQCGIKGFRKDVARHVFSKSRMNRYSFDIEILFIASKHGYNIKKIPVVVDRRPHSNLRTIIHGLGILADIFRIRLNYKKGLYNEP